MKTLFSNILLLIFLFAGLTVNGQGGVLPKLKLVQQGEQKKCVGESMILQLDASDFAGKTYGLAWRKLERIDTLFEGEALEILDMTVDRSGRYYCELLDKTENKRYSSDTILISVHVYPKSSLSEPAEALCFENEVTLIASANVANLQGLSYRWEKNSQAIAEDAAELTLSLTEREAVVYKVFISNLGCEDSAQITLAPVAYTSGLPATIDGVIGESLSLQASIQENTSYVWTINKAPIVTPNPAHHLVLPKMALPLREDTIGLTVTYRACPFVSQTIIDVKHTTESINASIKGEKKICVGDDLTYTLHIGSPVDDLTYNWCKVDGESNLSTKTTYAINNAQIEQSGKYYCELSSVKYDRTWKSDTINISVNVYPQSLLPAPTGAICYQSELTLTASAAVVDLQGLSYRWEKNKQSIAGNAAELSLSLTETDAVTYEVFIGNQGCEDSAKVTLTPIVYISGLPAVVDGVIGEPLSLTAATQENASYKWTVNETFTEANPAHILTLPQMAQPVREDIVKLTVAYDACTFVSQTTVDVKHSTESIGAKIQGEKDVCVGDNLAYILHIENPIDEFTYNWRKVKGESNLSNDITYTISNAQADRSGKYFCEIRSAKYDRKWNSDTIEIAVRVYPQTTLSAGTPCYSKVVRLHATSGAEDELIGLTYRWKRGDEFIAETSAVRDEIVSEKSDVIYKVFINNQGCEDSAQIPLIPIVPLLDIPSNLDVVIGMDVEVGNTPQETTTYEWAMKDEYTLSANGNSVHFIASLASDTVFVTARYRDCSLSDTTLLTRSYADIDAVVKINRGKTPTCAGEELDYSVTVNKDETISSGVSTYSYKWYKQEEGNLEASYKLVSSEEHFIKEKVQTTDNGKYYCQVYDSLFAQSYDSDTVSLAVMEYVSGLSARVDGVIGESLTLTATQQEGTDYAWTTNSGLSSVTNTFTFSRIVAPEREDTVNLVATYGGCIFESKTIIQVNHSDMSIGASIQGEKDFCVGDDLKYTLQIGTSMNDFTYNWCKVRGGTKLSETSSYNITDIQSSQSGKYYCEISSAKYDLVWNSDTIETVVHVYPGSILKSATTTPCYQGTVQLTATSSAGNEQDFIYSWKKNDELIKPTLAEINELIAETSEVKYEVLIENQGCKDSSEIILIPIVPIADLPKYVAVEVGRVVTVVNTALQDGATYTWQMKDEFTSHVANGVTFTATPDSDTVFMEVMYQNCTLSDTTLLQKSHADIDLIVKAIGRTRACIGDTLDYSLIVSESSQYKYTWYKLNGGVVHRTEHFRLLDAQTTDNGQYYCEVYNELFDLTYNSDTLDLLISAYPTLNIKVDGKAKDSKEYHFCRDRKISLEMEAQNEARYFWSGKEIIGNIGERTVSIIVSDSLLYTASVSVNGCSRIDSVLIIDEDTEVYLPAEKIYRIVGEQLVLPVKGDKENTYTWTGVSGVQTEEGYVFDVPPYETHIKVEAVNTVNGCEAKDSCELIGLPFEYVKSKNDGYVVSRLPIKLLQKDTTVCQRTRLEIEVFALGYEGYTYEWMKMDDDLGKGVSVDTGRIMKIDSIVDADEGQYYCRVSDLEKGTWTYSDTIQIKVAYKPQVRIVTPTEGSRLCGGTDIIYTSVDDNINNNLGNNYTWYGTGIKEGKNSATMTARVGDNGYYRLIVTADQCSDTAEVMVNPVIHRVSIPSDMIMAQSKNEVEFMATTKSQGEFSWFFEGENQNVTTANALLNIASSGNVVVKLTIDACHYYDTCRVMMRDFIGLTSSSDDGFAVSCPILRVREKEVSACEGGSTELGVIYLGYERYEYEWYKVDDSNMPGVLFDSIIFPLNNITTAFEGSYYCRAFNPDQNEYINSDTLYLTVNAGPVAKISSPQDGDKVCLGSEIVLTSSTSYIGDGSPDVPSVADRLEWIGEGIVSGQGTNRLTVKVSDNAVYTLRASKGDCKSETSVSLQVNGPVVDIPYVRKLNKAGNVELTAKCGSDYSALEWKIDNTVQSDPKEKMIFPVGKDVLVTVKATSEGCYAFDTCRVFVKEWTTFSGGDNDGFIVSRPRPLIPLEIKDMSVCPDSLITLRVIHADFGNYKYEWKRYGKDAVIGVGKEYSFAAHSDSTGRYYCRVQDADLNGGSYIHSDTMRLTVNDGPIAHIAASIGGGTPLTTTEICAGIEILLDASLSVEGVAGGDITYDWNGSYIMSDDLSLDRINVKPEKSVTYTLRVGNGSCFDMTSIHFEVLSSDFTIPDHVQLAKPDPKYVMHVSIPAQTQVKWGFKEEGGVGIPMLTNEINLTGDGWIYAYISQNDCEDIDSCRVFIKGGTTFKGGTNDGFHLQESSTLVWLEPEVDELSVCRDNQLKLKANVRGLGKYIYQWYQIKESIHSLDKQTDSVLRIDHMNEALVAKYFCKVTDIRESESGTVEYSTDTISVQLKDGPIAEISGVESLETCDGDVLTLFGKNINNSLIDANLVYEWSGDVYTVVDEVGTQIKAEPRTTGSYILNIRDNKSMCADTARLDLVMNNPKFKIPKQMFLAKSDQISILAETEGEGSVNWYIDFNDRLVCENKNPGVIDLDRDALVIAKFTQGKCDGYDTTRVYVKSPETFKGGVEDGFVRSFASLQGNVQPKFLNICRGTDLEIKLNINVDGRALKYRWMKVGSTELLSEEKDLVIRLNNMSTDPEQYHCLIIDPAIDNVDKRSVYSDTALVTLINGPIAQIVKPANGDKVCLGESIVIDASGTENSKVSINDQYSYEWFGEGISNTGQRHIINAVLNNNPEYVVKASLGECSTYDTLTLDIGRTNVQIPPVVFLSDVGMVTLEATKENESDEIQWNVYWMEDPTIVEPIVLGDTFKRHIIEDMFVVVSARNQQHRCLGYDTCQIFIKDLITFRGGDNDGYASAGTSFIIKSLEYTDKVCVGGNASFYLKVVGDEFYRYEWRNSNNDKIYSESEYCTIPFVEKSDEGYYYCIVTDVNNNSSHTSERVYLAVKEKPVSKIQMNDGDAVCYGDVFELIADQTELNENISYTYIWQGTGIANHLTAKTDVIAGGDGKYVLVVSDGDCFMTDTVDLIVEKAQLELPLVYHINQGEHLILEATVDGNTTNKLDWKVDGIPYWETATVTLSNLMESVEFSVQTTSVCKRERFGHIYVRGDDMYSGGYDDGFTMPNDLPQILDQCDVLLGCNVDTAVLWVVVGEEENLKIHWQKFDKSSGLFQDYIPITGATNVSGWDSGTLLFTVITEEDEGRYRCCLSNINGMVYSREIRLIKGGAPIINVPLIANAVCEKSEFNLGVTYVISNEGTNEGLKHKWYFGVDGVNFKQLLPDVAYDFPVLNKKDAVEVDEGYYMIEVSNYCGAVSDTVFQEIWEAPKFTEQPADQAFCLNSRGVTTIEVEGGGHYGYSLWQVEVDDKGAFQSEKRRIYLGEFPEAVFSSVSKIDEGYFTWVVWNECESTRSQPFYISVEEEIIANLEFVDTTICAGTDIDLLMSAQDNVVDPTPTVKYYWEKNNKRLEGANSNIYTIQNIAEEDAGVYICYAHHSCSPKPVKEYNVKTRSRANILLVTADNKYYCEETTAKLYVEYESNAGEVNSHWYYNNSTPLVNGQYIIGVDSVILTLDSVTVAEMGKYEVRLTNECGTISSPQVDLDVRMPARFTASGTLEGQSEKLCLGENRMLNVEAIGMETIIYTWMKDNQSIQSGKLPSLSLIDVDYPDAGIYRCFVSNVCNTSTTKGAETSANIEIVTPKEYSVNGGGNYCGSLGREVTLSGFERHVVYTLYQRISPVDMEYIPVATVSGDTVSTTLLTFGYMPYGFYKVEGTVGVDEVCSIQVGEEIEIILSATPRQFDFAVSDPMCTGESFGYVELSGSENNKNIVYNLERYDATVEEWVKTGAGLIGDGTPKEWIVKEGIYRVFAIDNSSGCSMQMGENDMLVERPYPQEFLLYAEDGDTTACYQSESDVVLTLAGNEETCSYTLMNNGITTGRELISSPISWDDVRIGVYSVLAKTNFGCTKEWGNIIVTELEGMDRIMLDGGRIYCEEETSLEHLLVLGGSTKGIRYDFYKEGNTQALAEYWGDGKALVHPVELAGDAVYYVIGVDTIKNCNLEMANRAEIIANHLQLRVVSPVTIPASTTVDLPVTIENAMGKPSVIWEPASKIDSVSKIYTATTLSMPQGDRFFVMVTDSASTCTKKAYIDVNVIGDPLRAEIKSFDDCYTSLDTLYLCEGDDVSLCAYIGGASENYGFKWGDDKNDSITVEHTSKLSYNKGSDGYVILSVWSDVIEEGVTIKKEATDTVQIIFRKPPSKLESDNEALTCVVLNGTTELVLKKMTVGVDYQLDFKGYASDKYTLVKDSKIVGTGRDTIYKIAVVDTTLGFYQITASQKYGDSKCMNVFPLTELQQAPRTWTMESMGGDLVYCADQKKDSIVVRGSEEGVSYCLKRDQVMDVECKVGTGNEIYFSDNYGSQVTGEHTYQVVATVDRCVDTMSGKVNITANERPVMVDNVDGMDVYCTDKNPNPEVNIIINPVQSIEYALYKDGVPEAIKTVTGVEPITLTHTLSLGTYFLVARNQGSNCTDTLRGLALVDKPVELKLVGDELGYCNYLSGYDKGVRFANADPMIRYELVSEAQVGLVHHLGYFEVEKDDTIRFDGILTIPEGQVKREYTVIAHAGTCTFRQYFWIEKRVSPLDLELRGASLLGCIGYDMEMGVMKAQTGVSYTLWREAIDGDEKLETLNEEGDIIFGNYNTEGVYYVVAMNIKTGCERRLTAQYHIRPLPEPYKIFVEGGKTRYCEGEDGVQIGIDGTQKGMLYRLQREVIENESQKWSNVVGVEFTGSGTGSELFSGYHKAGKYRIISDYCDLAMEGTVEITELPLPEDISVELAGNACLDSTINIFIPTPEVGITYDLYCNGLSLGMSEQSGASVSWIINPVVTGTYSVMAAAAGCQLSLKPEITSGRTVEYGELNGIVNWACAESTHTLWLDIKDADQEANYHLRHADKHELIYSGKINGDSIVFRDVPAGHAYYVIATDFSCETEKGEYNFDGVPVPQLKAEHFVVSDCKPEGEGTIHLKELDARYEYTLAGLTTYNEIKIFTGDTLFTNMENGNYVYKAYDPDKGCFSLPLEAIIRRDIPQDSIISSLVYCEGEIGVEVDLSARSMNITYILRDENGIGLDTISSPNETFHKVLPVGKYVYYRERTNLWGGCWLADTFHVEKYPLPNERRTSDQQVLCEAGLDNVISVYESEVNVLYYLQNTVTQENIDTIYGNGGKIDFIGRKPEGEYQIVMAYKGLCPVVNAKQYHVNPAPPKAVMKDQLYCVGSGVGSSKPDIKGLKSSAEYVLYNASKIAVDTIYGQSSGYFDLQPEGDYFVIGTYHDTKCNDTVAEMSIKGLSAPKVFTVSNITGGEDCGDVVVPGLRDGCEGDTVTYTLFINDDFVKEGPITTENGMLEFSPQKELGEYKIYAEKGNKTCGTWMDGSVIIYEQPEKAKLSFTGVECGEGTGSSVVISATKSVRNWLYYLSNGVNKSASLKGVTDETLTWDMIGDKPFIAGEYILYAINACDSILPMDTIVVASVDEPTKYNIQKINEGWFCSGSLYDLSLDSSDNGVVYSLYRGDEFMIEKSGKYPEKLLLDEVPMEGLFKVYGTVEATGCKYFIDSLTLHSDAIPRSPGVSGGDLCFSEGEDVEIIISVSRPRTPFTNYYLVVNGHHVDTILANEISTNLKFNPQTELGCYSVTAESKSGYCDLEEEGPCASMAPRLDINLLGGQRTEVVCLGDKYPVALDSSEIGMSYMLKNLNTGELFDTVRGTGKELIIGEVNEVAEYVVIAFVGKCEADIGDTLTIEAQQLPLLEVQNYYSYAEGGVGVKIGVLPETSDGVQYVLAKIENGTPVLAYYVTAEGGKGVVFDDEKGSLFWKEGIYLVYTGDNEEFRGCISQDTVTVEEVNIAKFELQLLGTPDKCQTNDTRGLQLSGSEKGTDYLLYHVAADVHKFISKKLGTNKAIDFGLHQDTGYFYVMAEKILPNGQVQKVKMGDDVRIYLSTAIEKFRLLGDTLGYCLGTNASGKVTLEKSQSHVEYQLHRNGSRVPGQTLQGTEGPLAWDKLEGRTCVGNNDVGYEYTVVAAKGECRVEMAGNRSIVITNLVSIISQTQSFPACTGDTTSVIVYAEGCHLNYKWTHDGVGVGDNSAGLRIDSMKVEDMGNYVCEISNYCNSEISEPIHIKVRQIVTMPNLMEDKLICGTDFQPIELVSRALGGDYAWFKVGLEDTLSNNVIYTIEYPTPDDAGEYYCITRNDCGALSDTIKLEFNRAPESDWEGRKKDTLCVGSSYSIHFETQDSVVWYFNEKEITNKHDKYLNFDSLKLEDEGAYQIKLVNACSEVFVNLVDLYVDDTIRITTPLKESMHYCENTPIVLAIGLTPNSRVFYEWEKNGRRVGIESTYTVPAIYMLEDNAWYRVSYKNQCSSGYAGQRVHVDKTITLEKMLSPDIECADGSEKLLIVEDKFQTSKEYNEYKWFKRTEIGQELLFESDTLRLDRYVNNRGIYYAEVRNTCEIVNSPDVDIRIDSIPIILGQPQSMSICENMFPSFKVKAKGGSLLYDWKLLKKNSLGADSWPYPTESYESESEWILPAGTVEYDSAQVWCMVSNACGEVVSTDTVLLRITKNIRLTVDKKVASICSNVQGEVKIAVVPQPQLANKWSYYVSKDGVEMDAYGPKTVYAHTDTLSISEAGKYRIYGFLTQATECLLGDSEVTVDVTNRELFSATLSKEGETTFCRFDKAKLRLQIFGGKAPWKVSIGRKKDGLIAPEFGGEPIIMTDSDTILSFNLAEDNTYYIISAEQYEDPLACVGEVSGEVSFITQTPLDTYFQNLSKKHFGSCKPIDLKSALKPMPEEGSFYVDGKHLANNLLEGKPGEYRITYRSETTFGCIDSVNVNLWLDSLPTSSLLSERTGLCAGEAATVEFLLKGVGPFKYQANISSYREDGTLTARPIIRYAQNIYHDAIAVYFSAITDGIDLERIESSKEIVLYKVEDAHGCLAKRDADDTIRFVREGAADYVVLGKHADYNNNNYTADVSHFIVPGLKKEVYFTIQTTSVGPWNLELEHTDVHGNKDTIQSDENGNKLPWSIRSSGTYRFTMSNNKCLLKTSTDRKITHLDSGYIQLKVCLEGAFKDGQMASPVFNANLVPLHYGKWSKWPVLTDDRKGIDWVTVELREDSVNGKIHHSEAFLLLSDGSIVDRNGRGTLAIADVNFEKPYFIVIRHRNHLSVGSKIGWKLTSDMASAKLLDLRLVNTIYHKEMSLSDHMIFVGHYEGETIMAMPSGNVFLNGLISLANVNAGILNEKYTPDYNDLDVNFDGQITLPNQLLNPIGDNDVARIYKNRSKYSEIKEKNSEK